MTAEVVPAPFTDESARALMEKRWGFSAVQTPGGVVVNSVNKQGPSSFLRKGDAITAVGANPVREMDDLLQAFRRERMAGQVLLQVMRNGKGYYARIMP